MTKIKMKYQDTLNLNFRTMLKYYFFSFLLLQTTTLKSQINNNDYLFDLDMTIETIDDTSFIINYIVDIKNINKEYIYIYYHPSKNTITINEDSTEFFVFANTIKNNKKGYTLTNRDTVCVSLIYDFAGNICMNSAYPPGYTMIQVNKGGSKKITFQEKHINYNPLNVNYLVSYAIILDKNKANSFNINCRYDEFATTRGEIKYILKYFVLSEDKVDQINDLNILSKFRKIIR